MHLKRTQPQLWKHFRPLYNSSKWLRYTDRSIDAQKVRHELIANRLAAIETYVYAELGVRQTE